MPDIFREKLAVWARRPEDALPDDHQVRHLDSPLDSPAFADTFREVGLV